MKIVNEIFYFSFLVVLKAIVHFILIKHVGLGEPHSTAKQPNVASGCHVKQWSSKCL